MKNQFINQMKTGDEINDFFAINRLDEILKYKSKSGSWFPFTIGDNTGIITAKFWGDTEEGTQTVYNFFSDAKVVRIVGKIEEYNQYTLKKYPALKKKRIAQRNEFF